MSLVNQALFILTGLLFALLCITAYDAIRQIRRRRRAEDTATARIRSAHQGYVELEGRLVTPTGEPLVTRRSKEPCVWWRYRVRAWDQDRWRVTERHESRGPWVLDDGTGQCLLDPEEAGLRPPEHGDPKFHGIVRMSSGPLPGAATPPEFQAVYDKLPRFARRFTDPLLSPSFTEEWIPVGTEVHVHGQFETRAVPDDTAVTQLLEQWRAAGRLDVNRDGAVDLREHEAGWRAALAQVRRANHARGGPAQVHTLRRPPDGRPFKSHFVREAELVRRSWLSARAFPWVLGAFVVAATLFFGRIFGP